MDIVVYYRTVRFVPHESAWRKHETIFGTRQLIVFNLMKRAQFVRRVKMDTEFHTTQKKWTADYSLSASGSLGAGVPQSFRVEYVLFL